MSEAQHKRHGKWSQSGVPKKGWVFIEINDLEEPSLICEMCESVNVRYAHSMEHVDYLEVLNVGCVCAARMAQDYVNPKQREKRLIGLARRRKTWSNRKWKVSQKGNHFINTDGYNLTVFQTTDQGESYWRVRVSSRSTNFSQGGNKRFEALEGAKAGALDALVWAKNKKAGLN